MDGTGNQSFGFWYEILSIWSIVSTKNTKIMQQKHWIMRVLTKIYLNLGFSLEIFDIHPLVENRPAAPRNVWSISRSWSLATVGSKRIGTWLPGEQKWYVIHPKPCCVLIFHSMDCKTKIWFFTYLYIPSTKEFHPALKTYVVVSSGSNIILKWDVPDSQRFVVQRTIGYTTCS